MEIRKLDDVFGVMVESKERVIELHNNILDDTLTDPQLTQLTSTSRTAIWRLWAFITAVCIWIHEYVWSLYQKEIQTIADSAIPNTAAWLQKQVLLFQYGHDLLFENYRPYYTTIDLSARIVARAAVIDSVPAVVKVAKMSGSTLSPLSNTELTALGFYIDQIKPVGTPIQLLSLNPDKIKIVAEVHYKGLLSSSAVKQQVELSINNYLANLPFDGRLYLSELQDAIQSVQGIVDVYLAYVGFQIGLLPYEQITREHQTYAGYCEIDAANPLSATITYLTTP